MDPDGKWTSTRAVLLAAPGQNCWPPAGSYMAATGQDLMAADSRMAAGRFGPCSCRLSGTGSREACDCQGDAHAPQPA